MLKGMLLARPVRARALQTSAITLAIMAAGPAFGQCSPDPVPANGTTICSGTDNNGLNVTTSGTTVNVLTGATVSGSGAPAIAVQVAPTADTYFPNTTLSVAGRVDGGSQAGARLLWQPAASGFGSFETRLTMTVSAGGVVTGNNGIVVGQSASGFGRAYVSIDNAGTISGTGGIALLSTYPAYAGFSSITNRAGGVIGAISAPVGTVDNAGTIDGGSRSAIDWGTVSGPVYGDTTNSGTIKAASSAATLVNVPGGRTITNSGSITNTGTGAAIIGDNLTLTNAAGGRISAAGATAIRANTFINLTNRGTIDGNVTVAAALTFTTGSRIDSGAGTINGDVLFGSGADTLIVNYANGRIVTGITGAIDGGAGTDMLRIRFDRDTSVGTALTLPMNFEQMKLAPDSGMTATLVDGFSTPDTLRIGGDGTIINRTILSRAAQVVATDFGSDGSTKFINAGTVRTTAGTSGTYALNLSSITRFENTGSVDASGSGISFSSQGQFVNSGMITATNTAVDIFGSNFANSGTIRSITGTGAVLSGSYGLNWTNSGRIEGAVAGVRVSSGFVNTGVITSPGTGVMLTSYGSIDNQAGGIISGGSRAIGPQFPNGSEFNTAITNAGTINGDVILTGRASSFSTSANRYSALPGGVLNGNLTLGDGDSLVTELVNTGTGAFAGITGTVSATNANLIYRVRSDATTTVAVPAGFAGLGYALFDDVTLTLTGPASSRPLTFAGQGNIDLTTDITVATQPAILTTPSSSVPYVANALTITSRGTLTLTRADTSSYYPYAVVALGSTDNFVNIGTIVARSQAATTFNQFAAIGNGKAITNSGTIILDGTIGVQGAQSFTNTGTITQAVGGRTATGVRASFGAANLVNSGTIDVAGNAVLSEYYGLTVTNSGRIASSATTAIAVSFYGSGTITNLAGGTIAGGAGQAIRLSGGVLSNAGTITGSVDLGYNQYGRSFLGAVYTANGGTIAGDLRFGDGDDIFVSVDGATGVSGTIDGGAGTDTYSQARTTNGTVTVGGTILAGFEREDVRAIGADTVVTVRADTTIAGNLSVSGDGRIVNTADVDGAVGGAYSGYIPGYATDNSVLTAFTNQGIIKGGFARSTASFANSGTIGTDALRTNAVSINRTGDLSFSNDGRIVNAGVAGNVGDNRTVRLSTVNGSIAATNTGTIEAGGLRATASAYPDSNGEGPAGPLTVSLVNSGTITGNGRAASLSFFGTGTGTGSASLDNSGTIEATGQGAIGAYVGTRHDDQPDLAGAVTVTNTGTIRANGDGSEETYNYWFDPITYRYTVPTTALYVIGTETGMATITNAATGTIEATGTHATAISAYEIALDLTNAGTIRGGAGTVLADDDQLIGTIGSTTLAGAIQTTGVTDDRIVNTGTITGSIALGAGNDRIENYGRIEGDVFLGLGDDTFLQRAGATLVGTVDGGEGTDSFIVDATGGGTVNGSQFVNFERFGQIGQGVVTYAGSFAFDTIGVSGGTVTVAVGQTLASTGGTTVTGSDAAETLINNGTILGAVALGGGDDSFVEGAGSRVAGGVDGGAGNDLYTVALAGDRSGIGQRSGFERLAVTGSGTLSLTLDQRFDTVSLTNTGLNLALAGQTVGSVTGSDGSETLAVDGDIAVVSLGAGDDTLALGTTRATGRYLGGAGNDTLRFTATGPVVLGGSATGFEQVALAGNVLAVTGTLGSAGAALSFGAGDQQLTVADGGTLAGTIDLGTGNDSFRLTANAALNGTVSGGAGIDIATVELAGSRTLASGLSNFETLATEGSGTLSLTGTQGYGQIVASGDLAVAAGGNVTATQVRFGAGNNRFTIAGQFTGAVDGGAGSDTIAVSGGSATAPVAFSTIANVEALAMTGGYATIANSGTLGAIDLTGGRLVGLAGSTITAPRIAVGQGATFGSAGTVIGNIAVAGTLSPGASPGTMTVTGNVALAGTSLSLFELTPTVSDKLVVAGTLSIATGATLQIVSTGTLRPGTSYDLITASGGISGSFTTVQKPDNVFGFIVQRADRLQLIGQFLGGAGFSPQVGRSIAYANATLAAQPATSTLFAALPALLTSSGASNAQAFARLTPEAYASASQLGVDNALTLAQTARGPAIATDREDVGLFTFAQTLGQWHTLGGDPATGTATARSQGYGMLGGLGIGDRSWAVGAFAGYLNSRQQIAALGTRTRTDGFVAGVHGRYAADNGFGFSASILYDGGDARTERALPGTGAGTAGATGRYDLHSWISDVSVSYAMAMAGDWTLKPKLGVTYVRTTRDGLGEAGGSPFALTVARDRHVAGFADAGVSLGRSDASDAPFRPFVALGARYQIEGRRTDALGGYAGGGLGLTALGAGRAELVGTATGGVAYRFANGLDLFTTASAQTGRDDHQETITTGVRLRF